MSTDVAPNRLAAAKEAGKQFTDELAPPAHPPIVAGLILQPIQQFHDSWACGRVCFDKDRYHQASTISVTTGSSSVRDMLSASPWASTAIAACTGEPASLRARRPFATFIAQSRQGTETPGLETMSAARRCHSRRPR